MKHYILKNKLAVTVIANLFAFVSFAQDDGGALRINKFADFSAAVGSSQQSIAASYVYNWRVGKKRKFELGLGLRNTAYFGLKKDFWTAPAKLARSTTFPFAVVFAGQETQNWDTLTVQRPFTNSINITANIGYHFLKRWYGGFNIDLIGYTFGRKGSGILTSNGITRTESNAKPAAFNLLLTGDNDLGSLNSEFFINYHLNKKWSLKALYQFLFVEYKTSTIKQTAPDGSINDRFRNKANNLGLGIAYRF